MAKRKPTRRILTDAEEATIRRELARGATDAEAGQAAGVSDRKLYRARLFELADLPRNKRGPRPGRVYPPPPEFVDLTVEEIYRRAAELRASRWTEDERQARWNPGFSGRADS
jgi:hypothetical protein